MADFPVPVQSRLSDNRDLRALHALSVVQPNGRRTFLEEEEVKETITRQGGGDSPWPKELRTVLSQTP